MPQTSFSLATDYQQALFLTQGMARRHGVDLSLALQQGVLARPDLAQMVDRCRACAGTPDACRDFQEDHDHGQAAPDWCANRAVLEGLRGAI